MVSACVPSTFWFVFFFRIFRLGTFSVSHNFCGLGSMIEVVAVGLYPGSPLPPSPDVCVGLSDAVNFWGLSFFDFSSWNVEPVSYPNLP